MLHPGMTGFVRLRIRLEDLVRIIGAGHAMCGSVPGFAAMHERAFRRGGDPVPWTPFGEMTGTARPGLGRMRSGKNRDVVE